MPINKDQDYFIPVLAPYVQWVKAYRELISSLYEDHKTVRKAWKAFRDAIPGVERRLEFSVFEQILLFSLFLSEWDNSGGGSGSVDEGGRSKRGGRAYPGKEFGNQLDTVIQKLHEAMEERDRALWNLKHHEQSAITFKEQKAHLEKQAVSLEKNLEVLQNELEVANEQSKRVIHELDNHKAENAGLREQNTALRDREASLEQQIERLRKKLDRLALDKAQARQIMAVEKPDSKEGFTQAVIQWVRQGGQEVIQNSNRNLSPKKIGRWNAQLSRDGYYRLYRKIGGRVHSIYIGKNLDIDKAERRIADKERELLRLNPAMGSQIKMEAPSPVYRRPARSDKGDP